MCLDIIFVWAPCKAGRFRHKSQLTGTVRWLMWRSRRKCFTAVNRWCNVRIKHWNQNGIRATCTSISVTSGSVSLGMWWERELHPTRQLSWFQGREEHLGEFEEEHCGMEGGTKGAEGASVRQEDQRSLLPQYGQAGQDLQNKERGGRDVPAGAELQRDRAPNMGVKRINSMWLPDMLPWLGDTRQPSSANPVKWCEQQNGPKSEGGRSLWAGRQCSVCLRRDGGRGRAIPVYGLPGLDVEADTKSIELLWRGPHHIQTRSHSCPLLQHSHQKGLAVWGAADDN